MAAKKIVLKDGEYIDAIVADRCSGPGWSNRLVTVVICHNGTNATRREFIQPEEQTAAMHALFGVAAEVNLALLAAVPVVREAKS